MQNRFLSFDAATARLKWSDRLVAELKYELGTRGVQLRQEWKQKDLIIRVVESDAYAWYASMPEETLRQELSNRGLQGSGLSQEDLAATVARMDCHSDLVYQLSHMVVIQLQNELIRRNISLRGLRKKWQMINTLVDVETRSTPPPTRSTHTTTSSTRVQDSTPLGRHNRALFPTEQTQLRYQNGDNIAVSNLGATYHTTFPVRPNPVPRDASSLHRPSPVTESHIAAAPQVVSDALLPRQDLGTSLSANPRSEPSRLTPRIRSWELASPAQSSAVVHVAELEPVTPLSSPQLVAVPSQTTPPSPASLSPFHALKLKSPVRSVAPNASPLTLPQQPRPLEALGHLTEALTINEIQEMRAYEETWRNHDWQTLDEIRAELFESSDGQDVFVQCLRRKFRKVVEEKSRIEREHQGGPCQAGDVAQTEAADANTEHDLSTAPSASSGPAASISRDFPHTKETTSSLLATPPNTVPGIPPICRDARFLPITSIARPNTLPVTAPKNDTPTASISALPGTFPDHRDTGPWSGRYQGSSNPIANTVRRQVNGVSPGHYDITSIAEMPGDQQRGTEAWSRTPIHGSESLQSIQHPARSSEAAPMGHPQDKLSLQSIAVRKQSLRAVAEEGSSPIMAATQSQGQVQPLRWSDTLADTTAADQAPNPPPTGAPLRTQVQPSPVLNQGRQPPSGSSDTQRRPARQMVPERSSADVATPGPSGKLSDRATHPSDVSVDSSIVVQHPASVNIQTLPDVQDRRLRWNTDQIEQAFQLKAFTTVPHGRRIKVYFDKETPLAKEILRICSTNPRPTVAALTLPDDARADDQGFPGQWYVDATKATDTYNTLRKAMEKQHAE
ncbi:hypothetical protein PV11_03699 [Exophiala sideris]|uniref:Uncharacterized protein n=1 Tax=Exophiala sideris TaxID=1016849 RepID=A0A0D1X226_9EURO|nr:hypothetical protein PV11_03699 [Exophiala sideris]